MFEDCGPTELTLGHVVICLYDNRDHLCLLLILFFLGGGGGGGGTDNSTEGRRKYLQLRTRALLGSSCIRLWQECEFYNNSYRVVIAPHEVCFCVLFAIA